MITLHSGSRVAGAPCSSGPCSCGFPVPFAGPKAGAWGNFGHESIALVAWVELSPAQKAAVDAIFAGAPSIYGTSRGVGALMFAATWPDVLREGHEHGGHLRVPLHIFQKLDAQYSDAKAVDNLHFADFDEATEKLAEPADNVATAVNIALGFLRDRNSTPIQKGEALSYLIHCVGDAHQPLHAGYIEDLGGNHIAIQKLGGSTSLHAAWDTGFFATTKYYVRGRTLPTAFVSDVLAPLLPTVQSDALASLNPADWVTESHSLAKKYAYLDENRQKIATGATLSAHTSQAGCQSRKNGSRRRDCGLQQCLRRLFRELQQYGVTWRSRFSWIFAGRFACGRVGAAHSARPAGQLSHHCAKDSGWAGWKGFMGRPTGDARRSHRKPAQVPRAAPRAERGCPD